MGWRKVDCICETVQEAARRVACLLEMQISAYRQGKTVYIDDGGADDGYSENNLFTGAPIND